ncbi:hypothetical protein AAOE16_05550 [Ekhidna sp. MALMAid0563]|uniref:hypothetical protein n=1 Tax=Ekhidna sp. MALMAid0563 TaxID=3143937 RepID=UPI0032DF440A
MKPITTNLLSVLMLFCCYQVQGQNIDSTNNETIIKRENPYRKGKTKWLNSSGFNTETYNWNHPEINLYLDESLKKRSVGNILVYSGGVIIVTGLFLNVVGSFVDSAFSNKPDEPYQVFKAPYFLGGAMVVSSIPFHIKSNKKLKQAIKLKKSR